MKQCFSFLVYAKAFRKIVYLRRKSSYYSFANLERSLLPNTIMFYITKVEIPYILGAMNMNDTLLYTLL